MNSFFGTDGIRAPMGTALFTQQSLAGVADAISHWLNNAYAQQNRRPRVLIIHDTRNSCAYIKSIFKMSFLSQSIDVFDANVLPTPAASYLIKKNKYDCGLVISASHNAWHDNGIKIIDASGKISPETERAITAFINNPLPTAIDYLALGNDVYVNGAQEYQEILLSYFTPQFLNGMKIVLDCAHGATAHVAPEIFRKLGATVVSLHDQPTGFNINENCGSLKPEMLQQAVVEHQADIGFAFDGDGDRVLAVNRYGVLKNGDALLALLSLHPDYVKQPVVVGTIMSNVGLEVWLAQQDKRLLRTAVGDKYVAQELIKQESLLGGEQSGHILLKNYINTGDGILVALKVLETMLLLDNKNLETFSAFPQILLTVPVKKVCDLSENPYDKLIETAEKRVRSGRISVRYSGTEKNMLRIMVESELLDDAYTIAHYLADSLQKELS